MSSAKKDNYKDALCLHKRKLEVGFFHRANARERGNTKYFRAALRRDAGHCEEMHVAPQKKIKEKRSIDVSSEV